MKGFKGFSKDFTCQGFQYKENEIYKTDKEIELCNRGFHFCENPFDVMNYYGLNSSIYCEVEATGSIKKEKDKSVTSEIKIGVKIALNDYIGKCVNFLVDLCKKVATAGNYAHSATTGDSAHSATAGNSAHSATTGDYAHSATTGNSAHSATAGNSAHSATTGDSAHSATTGDSAHSATAGNYAHSATAGNYAHSATAGNYAHSATAGYSAHSATAGYSAHSATTGDSAHSATAGNSAHSATAGYSAHSATTGNSAIACGIGINNQAKSKKGNWIVLAEHIYNDKLSRWEVKTVKTIKVDGKKIKENTWYILEKGKFKEVK
jgi:hypothetical protein